MDDFQPDDFTPEESKVDDFQPDDFQPDNESPMDFYKKSQFGSPQSLLESVPTLASTAFGKLGNFAEKTLSEGPGPVHPIVAKGVGKFISYAPDIAMMGINPTAEEAMASKAVPDVAVPLARRGIGMAKSMLKTAFSRGQADKAAKVALEENIIPLSGNPEVALERASGLANKVGGKIGIVLKKTPINLERVDSNLEMARNEISKGFSGGVFQKAHNVIDDIKFNLNELANAGKSSDLGIKPILDKPQMASRVNQIKTRLARSINYMADLASQSDNKTVVNNLANSIREAVKSAMPGKDYQEFISNQRLFNMAELMKKGLNNEVASQMGNRMFSPYSVIPAAGELITGNPAKAAATLGVTEGIMRRGAGSGARMLTEGYRKAPLATELISKSANIYNRPEDVRNAYNMGKIDRKKAIEILKNEFGHQ